MESGVPLTEVFHHIGHAIVLHELNRKEDATSHLEKAHGLARSSKVPLAEFMCLLAQARFGLDKGDDRSGLASLKQGLSFGKEKRYVNTYYWQPAVMAELCKKALEAGFELKYVQALIQKRHLMPDPPPYDCELWPWPLRINTLGRFELIKNQEPVGFLHKAPRRALSLLKALISAGRKGVGEEQLVDALWPDADGDKANQAFDTTLHRLRQLLGNEKFIVLHEGHLELNPRFCMVDAYAFEHLLEQAEVTESIPLFQKAICLYHGRFMADDPGEPWAFSYRERLRSKFLRAIRKLGFHFEQNGQKEKAIEYYQKGLEVESLAEEFYQQLMICHQSEGRTAEALAVYNECCKVLESVLKVKPSAKTRSIYDAVRQNP
jgi:DNA-binding SARP family transcriptional activator